ncbi:hypothetical protein M3626_06085 [Psychrobacillus sp. MER TA 17]|nr:hypothetical protein [Psychrobacillus sp. MER TA 17]
MKVKFVYIQDEKALSRKTILDTRLYELQKEVGWRNWSGFKPNELFTWNGERYQVYFSNSGKDSTENLRAIYYVGPPGLNTKDMDINNFR